MATYVIGLILLVLLGFAVRHVWNNFRSGKHDCCGSDCGCGRGSNCISRNNKAKNWRRIVLMCN